MKLAMLHPQEADKVIIPVVQIEKPHSKIKKMGFVHGSLRLNKG